MNPRTQSPERVFVAAEQSPGCALEADPQAVLVIEDDADTRANLCDLLELDDYRVSCAGSIAETLARGDLRRFGAVILDRRLPDGTADDLLPRLVELAPNAGIIVVTGYVDLEGAIAALRSGAADYTLKPVDPLALRASLARVTQRQRLAIEKRRAETAFRELIEAAPCMIIISRPDGPIVYLNPFAERVTGYSAPELVGGCDLKNLLPDLAAKAGSDRGCPDWRARQGVEALVRCKDESDCWAIWSTRLLEHFEGAPAVLAVGQDVSQLREAQRKALQTERLAAIGEMITGLAHESRNALQRSRACLEMLAFEVEDRPEALDLVERLQKAQAHLQHLYEEVRTYAAPLNLKREPCDIAHLWREIWANLSHMLDGKVVELREEIETRNLFCSIDRFGIGQVLLNIFENAIAVVPAPGDILVRCRDAILSGQPAIKISISDNGPGLSLEQQQRIFEPFYTTKTKGTGLGMAIAKRIVDSHGGRLEVCQRPPPGAELVLVLTREANG